ncbi:MAG: hypothetical protein WC393_05785 [Candidatus Nanoarchaeia archaeon]|jgi:hypothetical protein
MANLKGYFIGTVKKVDDLFFVIPELGYNKFTKKNRDEGFFFNPLENYVFLRHDDKVSSLYLLKDAKKSVVNSRQYNVIEEMLEFGKINGYESIPSLEFKANRVFFACAYSVRPDYSKIVDNELKIEPETFNDFIKHPITKKNYAIKIPTFESNMEYVFEELKNENLFAKKKTGPLDNWF